MRKDPASRRVNREIREMKDVTEPITSVYSWVGKYINAQGFSMVVPLLQWNDAYDIGPFHNNLLTQLNNPTTTPSPLNKFAVGGYSGDITIKNCANVEMTMDIYTIVWRDDTTAGLAVPTNWNTNGSSNVRYASPFTLLLSGVMEAGNATAPFVTTWPVGLTPYNVAKFCSYYKIIKVKKDVRIIGGNFKSYKVRDKKWRIWDGTKIGGANYAINAIYNGFARRTKCVFAIMTGMGYNEETTNNCNFAPLDVLLTGQERYSYTGINNSSKKIFIVQDTNTVTTPAIMNLQTEIATGYVAV